MVELSINKGGEVGSLLNILLYFTAFIAIIYALYKLFGLFKNVGGDIEKKLNELRDKLNDIDLNPSDAPGRFEQTGKDIWTMMTKPGTPEGNAAKTRVHYGGPQWGPGTGFDTSKAKSSGVLKKYGQDIKPGETKTFDGGWYTEVVKSNLTKSPDSNEYISKEDALARKYGFSTYAQFNAWLAGVKAALKAAGKDPSSMTLDQIVKYGRELEKKKKSGTAYFAAQGEKPVKNSHVPAYKPVPSNLANKLDKVVHPKMQPIGGSPASMGLMPLGNGMCKDVRNGKIIPCPT